MGYSERCSECVVCVCGDELSQSAAIHAKRDEEENGEIEIERIERKTDELRKGCETKGGKRKRKSIDRWLEEK